jgi:GxxExxY protein
MAELVEKELSYAINRSLFEVHNQVGPGLREECYQHALACSFHRAGLSFQAKPATRTEFVWKGSVVDIFEPDFIVADRVVVELKHQPEGFARQNDAQVLTYLKHFRLPLGILVNFALDKAAIRRLPYTERTTSLHQDLQQLPLELTPRARQAIGHATQVIAEAHAQFGVGYPGATYRNLLLVGLRAAGVGCSGELLVTPRFGEVELPTSHISPATVEECLCVETEAVLQAVSARAIRTMQAHLRWTGCEAGLIASFGKQRCEIRGVRPRYRDDNE